MGLGLLVLLGLLCAGAAAESGSGDGSELSLSELDPYSMLLMPFTSTLAEILTPLTTNLASLTLSTMPPASLSSTTFLPAMPSSTLSLFPSSSTHVTPSLSLLVPSPAHSSSSSLQFLSTLPHTVTSASSSTAAFTLQPALTHSPIYSSSSSLQFPSSTLPYTVSSASSSSAAFTLQSSLTHSPIYSSSSSLQFPSSTLPHTVSSASSSTDAFTLQPALTHSPIYSSSSSLQFPSSTLPHTVSSASSSSAAFTLQPALTHSPIYSSSSSLQFPSSTLPHTVSSVSSSSAAFTLQSSLTHSPIYSSSSSLQFPSSAPPYTISSASSSSAAFTLQPTLTHSPIYSSSSSLQFLSSTLLHTVSSASSSSAAFALQPTLTHSPLYFSSSLQFPSSTLPHTVYSASSSSVVFTFEPVTSPSFTYYVTPTSSSTPLLSSSEPTAIRPINDPLTVLLPGAVAGGVVIMVLFSLLVVIVCVMWRRKRNARHRLYSITPHKDLCIFTEDDKNKQEYTDLLSSSTEFSHRNLFEFGITADSFGIKIGCPDEEGGSNRPALIFINAVDPTIPVTSNTLPTRRKAKNNNTGVDLVSHFEGLSSSKLEKGYKSMEYVHQVGTISTDRLLTQEKQELKPNSSDHSLSNDDTKTIPLLMIGGYEHLFMEALCSSKTSTFKCEREDVNSPRELLKTSQSDAHMNDNLPVPKRLEVETRLATGDEKLGYTLKQTSIPKKESSAEENMDASKKGTGQPTSIDQTLFTIENDMKLALGDMCQAPMKPTTSPTELGGKPITSPISKPQGIYDKPCSDVPGRSKPKITPRNPNIKIISKTKTEGIYHFPKSTLLHSSSQIVKHDDDDIGNVNGISTETLAAIKPQLMPKPKLLKAPKGDGEPVKPPVAK